MVEGKPLYQVVPPPSEDQLQKLLHQIMQRLMKYLTFQEFLTEEEDISVNETDDLDPSLVSLHSASYTYRITLGPRAGQHCSRHPWLRSISTSMCKIVLTLKTAEPKDWGIPSDRCVNHNGDAVQ